MITAIELTPRNSKRREDAMALVLLALLVMAAFPNVIFGGRSLVASDNHNPLDYRMRGPNPVPAEEWLDRGLVLYPNFRDIASAVMQTDPSREFLRRSLARGEFPFWDPYLAGGTPSFASLTPAYLFPPSLVVVLLGNGRLITNAYILLLIYSAGVLTYFLLRRHVEHWLAAFAGAAAFMLSGAVVMTAPSVVGQPVAFFALPLLMTARLLEAPTPRRAAHLALAFAFVAMATFPPASLQAFGMAVVYLILARPSRRAAGWFAIGAAVSLLIVAVAYLPGILLMAEMTHVREYYRHAALAVIPAKNLAQILSAKIAGGVPTYVNPPVGIETGHHMYYTGIAALFLAGIGILTRPASARARILHLTALLTIILFTMKLIGLPPMQWIAHAPLLRNFHYAAYLGMAIAFSVALFAALGVDAFLRGTVKAWTPILTGGALATILIAIRVATYAQVAAHPNGARWTVEWWLLALFLCLSAILWWIARQKQSRMVIAMAILVLAAEGIHNSFYPRPRRWDHWSQPPRYLELMTQRNTGGRVLPMPVFPANTQSVAGLPTLDSILSASPRMYELYRTYFGPIPDVILRETKRIPPERVLDAANIEYFTIVSTDAANLAEVASRGYETLFADDYMHLVRRPTEPRYTFTSQYEVAGAKRALDQLPALPRGTVFVETAPQFASTAGATVVPLITDFRLNEVSLRIDTPRDGLLVCSESNMRGWSATVDGRPARILAANYAFRAVEVPPGSHTVRFAYRTPGLVAGAALSIIGLLLCAAGALSARGQTFAD